MLFGAIPKVFVLIFMLAFNSIIGRYFNVDNKVMYFRIRVLIAFSIMTLHCAHLSAQKPPAPGELARAAAQGNQRQIEALLSRGANPDQTDSQGKNALMYAVESGSYQLVERLLDAGANPDIPGATAETPLMRAVFMSREDLVVLLLTRLANPNTISDAGSPLSSALNRGEYDIAGRLVEFGADGLLLADTKPDVPNPLGFPELEVALDARMWREAASLRYFAASPDWDAGIRREVDSLAGNAARREIDRWRFHRAVRDNNWEIITDELNTKRPPDTADGRGVTPLMLASWYGNAAAAALLLQRGADPLLQDSLGRNALCYATLAGNRKLVKILLQASESSSPASTVAPGKLNESPLYYALLAERQAILDDLLAAGYPTDLVDEEGITLLMIAAWRGNAYAVDKLLPLTDGRWDENPQKAQTDNAGRTALEWSLAAFKRDRDTGRSIGNPDRGAWNYAALRLLAGRMRKPEETRSIPTQDTHPAVITSWWPSINAAAYSLINWQKMKPSPVPNNPNDGDLTLYRILMDEEQEKDSD